jgi:hypothetical protein
MLRARNRVTLNPATTGVDLTVTHGLGTTADMWWIVPCSTRAQGRTYVPAAAALTANTITVCNSVQTNATVDVFTLVFQGRLY